MLLAGILCISANSKELKAQRMQAHLMSYNSSPIEEINSFNRSDTTSSRAPFFWNVHSRALRLFEKDYKNVDKVDWFVIGDGFMAKFTADDISYKVCYNKKGNWVQSTRQYNEAHLPKDVRHIVKSNYYDFDISTVVENNKFGKVSYYVVMSSSTEWLKVSVIEGELLELERFYKSK